MGFDSDSLLVVGVATLAVALVVIVSLVSYWRKSKQDPNSHQADGHQAQVKASRPAETDAPLESETELPGPAEPEAPPVAEGEPSEPAETGAPPEADPELSEPAEREVPPEADPELSEPAEREVPPEADPELSESVEPEAPPEAEPELSEPAEPEAPPEAEPELSEPAEPEVLPEADHELSEPAEPEAPPEAKAELPGPTKPEGPPEAKSRPPGTYVPAIRTPKTTRRKSRKEPKESVGQRSRPITLQVAVRAVFGRRNSIQVSLLPARSGDLGEEIDVTGPNEKESWFACQDEWYCDFIPADIGDCLANGMRWASGSATWTLSPRGIFVLVANQTISGFVSTTRLLLNEDHLILCQEGAQEVVREELEDAGCVEVDCRSGNGIPEGWVLFSNVRPTVAVDHDESAGIRNVLRPLEDIDIYLEGGIRLSHKRWLHGHSPRIRIRGGRDDNPAVAIDARAASRNSDGSFETQNAFSLGKHVVFCGGVTEPYEIAEGKESWDPFEAFMYRMDREQNTEVSVCGPVVMGDGEQTLVPATNRCLVGAKPGDIYLCESPYDESMNAMLAITEFPVAWALPANPYQCKKSEVFAIAISAKEVSPIMGSIRRRPRLTDDVFRWCNAILNSSRKGLRPGPVDGTVMKLWLEYVRVAREIRRSMK